MLWEQGGIDEEVILGLILTCVMTRKYLPKFYYPKKSRIELLFLGGRGGWGGREETGVRFSLKTGIDFAYRAWFLRELRECMNASIISVLND